jgi:hypothetical protein
MARSNVTVVRGATSGIVVISSLPSPDACSCMNVSSILKNNLDRRAEALLSMSALAQG